MKLVVHSGCPNFEVSVCVCVFVCVCLVCLSVRLSLEHSGTVAGRRVQSPAVMGGAANLRG